MKKIKCRAILSMSILLTIVGLLGISDYAIPDRISRFSWEESRINSFLSYEEEPALTVSAQNDNDYYKECTATVKLFGVVPIKTVDVNVYDNLKLYPGGMPFGVKLYTEGLIVIGFSEVDTQSQSKNPAQDAGIKIRDIITKVNGKAVSGSESFISEVEKSNGEPLSITLKRDNEEINLSVTPSMSESEGKYKTGMWIRDSTAGIGTVTFITPSSNSFAGLGHGICDTDTGALMPLMRGSVSSVSINRITKGICGTPGELIGYFNAGKLGNIIGNTNAGVFGVLNSLPSNIPEAPLPIGLKDEVKEGKAYIWCTLDDNKVEKYNVEIIKISPIQSETKNFMIRVTDKRLLDKTGGIVQGMSGSPIIQNGKLIGAVTHVLINDPTEGYGIYIENMLANMPDILK